MAGILKTEKNIFEESVDTWKEKVPEMLCAEQWESAEALCDEVLESDPDNANACLLKLMARLHCRTREDFKDAEQPFDSDPLYKKVIDFSSVELQAEMRGYILHIKERIAEAEAAERKRKKSKTLSSVFKNLFDKHSFKIKKDGTVTIRRKSNITENTDLSIPEYINGIKVTGIGSHAFDGCGGLVGVEIPRGVLHIGDYAFWRCPIKSATVCAEHITEIPKAALESVVIIGGGRIGNKAFYRAEALKNIKIPNCVTSIGEYAFQECKNLEKIEMTPSVTFISRYAFSRCDKLKKITLPPELTEIGEGLFWESTGLVSIKIPRSVTSIYEFAFKGCKNLKNLIFEDTDGWYMTRNKEDFLKRTGGEPVDVSDSEANLKLFDCKCEDRDLWGMLYFYKLKNEM